MWWSAIELGALDARHAHALGLHLLALEPAARHGRFGHTLGDEAVLDWVRRLPWAQQRWWGAWTRGEALLIGALQLAPAGMTGWELGLSVAAPARGRGLGTALLATAAQHLPLRAAEGLVCVQGHPAVRRMAHRLGWSVSADAAGWWLRPPAGGWGSAGSLLQKE